jgi:hypothetical protein
MMTGAGRDERHDRVVLCHDVDFADVQFEIEDVKEFALDPTDVALAKDTSAYSPVHVLERRVIQVLARDNERAKEHPFIGPLFECYVEMWLGPVEVDKGGQYDGHFYFSPKEDVLDHSRERRSFISSRGSTATA